MVITSHAADLFLMRWKKPFCARSFGEEKCQLVKGDRVGALFPVRASHASFPAAWEFLQQGLSRQNGG